jgi:hypothetical protein
MVPIDIQIIKFIHLNNFFLDSLNLSSTLKAFCRNDESTFLNKAPIHKNRFIIINGIKIIRAKISSTENDIIIT